MLPRLIEDTLRIDDLLELLDEVIFLTDVDTESERHKCCGSCPCAGVSELANEAYITLSGLGDRFVLVETGLWESVKLSAQALADNDSEINALARRLKRRTRSIRPTLRAAVLKRDAGRCRYCGVVVDEAAQMDHYEPDGLDIIENLVTACPPCNAAKGNTQPRELRRLKGMALLGRSVEQPPTTRALRRR